MDENAREKFYKGKGLEYVKQNTFERLLDKLFFALKRDIKVTFLVLTIVYASFMTHLYIGSLETRNQDLKTYKLNAIERNEAHTEEMIREIRRTVTPMLYRRIDRKTKKIEAKVDTVGKNIENLTETLKKSL